MPRTMDDLRKIEKQLAEKEKMLKKQRDQLISEYMIQHEEVILNEIKVALQKFNLNPLPQAIKMVAEYALETQIMDMEYIVIQLFGNELDQMNNISLSSLKSRFK